MEITQYKKISEMTPVVTINQGAMFPFILPGILENYIIDYKNLSESIRNEIPSNQNLILQTNGTTRATYNGSTLQTFNVTPNNIGTYTSQEIDNKINAIVAESFIKYTGTDIVTSGLYTIDTKRDMMYQGTFNSDISLALSSVPTNSYGTTYMFLRNTSTTNAYNITLQGSSYYLPSQNIIEVPAATNIEIATKSYGNITVTTYLLGVPGEEAGYVNMTQVLEAINTALNNYYTKSQTYTKTEVDTLLSNLDLEIFIPVESLPSVGESNKIYILSNSSSETGNLYDEYIWHNNAWEKIGQMTLDLSAYYNKTESDARFAPISHTHSDLTLRIGGVAYGSYNGGSDVNFDVTTSRLGVYAKNETYSNTQIDGLISNFKNVWGSTVDFNGGTVTFSLINNREIYTRINLNGATLNIVESPIATISHGASILYSIKNVSSNDAIVNFPTGSAYEYMGDKTSITIPAGMSIEVGIVSFGEQIRSLTYATMGFVEY